MSDTRELLKQYNPGGNFSTADLVSKLMAEHSELANQRGGSGSPEGAQAHREMLEDSVGHDKFMPDFAEGFSSVPVNDYSRYKPQSSFNLAQALQIANQVSPEDREYVLDAMMPRYQRPQTGFSGFIEGLAPQVSAGLGNVSKKRELYIKEAEKARADELEYRRKMKKAEADYALSVYKMEQKEALEARKMAAQERRHRESMSFRERALAARGGGRDQFGGDPAASIEAQQRRLLMQKALRDSVLEPGAWYSSIPLPWLGDDRDKRRERANAMLGHVKGGGDPLSYKDESFVGDALKRVGEDVRGLWGSVKRSAGSAASKLLGPKSRPGSQAIEPAEFAQSLPVLQRRLPDKETRVRPLWASKPFNVSEYLSTSRREFPNKVVSRVVEPTKDDLITEDNLITDEMLALKDNREFNRILQERIKAAVKPRGPRQVVVPEDVDGVSGVARPNDLSLAFKKATSAEPNKAKGKSIFDMVSNNKTATNFGKKTLGALKMGVNQSASRLQDLSRAFDIDRLRELGLPDYAQVMEDNPIVKGPFWDLNPDEHAEGKGARMLQRAAASSIFDPVGIATAATGVGAAGAALKGLAKLAPLAGGVLRPVAKAALSGANPRNFLKPGALGADLGANLANEYLDDKTDYNANLASRILAGVTGGALGRGVANIPGRVVGKAPGKMRLLGTDPLIDKDLIKDYKDIGIKPGIVDVTNNKTLYNRFKVLQKNDRSGKVLRDKESRNYEQIKKNIAPLMQEGAETVTFKDVADEGVVNLYLKTKFEASKGYQQVEKAVRQGASKFYEELPIPTKMKAVANAQKDGTTDIMDMIPLDLKITKGSLKEKGLKGEAAKKAIREYLKGPHTLESAKRARDVWNAKGQGSTPDSRDFQVMANNIRADIAIFEEKLLKHSGDKAALKRFEELAPEWHFFRHNISDPTNKANMKLKLGKRRVKNSEYLLDNLKEDGSSLPMVLESLPKDKQKELLAAYFISLGKDPAKSGYSLNKLSTSYNKLPLSTQKVLSEEIDRLYGVGSSKRLNSALKVLTHMKKLSGAENFSNTAGHLMADNNITSATDFLTKAAVGDLGKWGKTVALPFIANRIGRSVLGHNLTHPSLLKRALKLEKRYATPDNLLSGLVFNPYFQTRRLQEKE